MKSSLLLALLFCFCLFASAQKKQKLFNGKDLTGWTVHGTEKWYVENSDMEEVG